MIELDDGGVVLFFLVTSAANSVGVSGGNVIFGADCTEGASMLNYVVGSYVFLFFDFGGPLQQLFSFHCKI